MSLERVRDYERAVSDLNQYTFNLMQLFLLTYGRLPHDNIRPFYDKLDRLHQCLCEMTVGVTERYVDFKIKIPGAE